ncbi:non-classical arabinogalactan protein 30-like [Argentina anserina]|uniref:non-classical arabinogalactan protein 30-like n=1 Tax=Argentina anserina TaxID=57926 RepID=UPI002176352A|nr:non-classical arabinogalactan protein 30-like [Potentilla anserina]
MASKKLILVASSFLLIALAFSPSANAHPAKPEVHVVVEGMVYCQSCDYRGWSLTGAKPLPLAKVSIVCKNNIGQVGYYKTFQANANGYVYAELEGNKMNRALDYPLLNCRVKLVSSPLQKCNLATNVNFGLDGAPLRSEGKSYTSPNYKAVIYAAGPFAFRPAHCPRTTHH